MVNTYSPTRERRQKSRKFVPIFITCLILVGLGVGAFFTVLHVKSQKKPVVSQATPPRTTSIDQAKQTPPTPVVDQQQAQPPAPSPSHVQHDYTIPPVANGAVPVITHIPTKEPVIFLTIDDGIFTNPSDAQVMQSNNVKATFFLVNRFVQSNYGFFSDLAEKTGSDIQNHTYDHYLLTNQSLPQQTTDICKNADIFTQKFGTRPVIMRPSGGAYNTDSPKAAAACNMKALVLWDVTVNNGAIQYASGHTLHSGDIVLMHFRKTFQEDLTAFAQAAKAAGLQTDLLVNWLP